MDWTQIRSRPFWLADMVYKTSRAYIQHLKGKVPILTTVSTREWGDGHASMYTERHFPDSTRFDWMRWHSPIPPLFCPGIVHFYSRYTLLSRRTKVPIQNYRSSILTWFHGDPAERTGEFNLLGRRLEPYLPSLTYVTTSCQLTHDKLSRWGVPESKLRIVPFGIDLGVFRPPSPEQKKLARENLGVPDGSFCIGSFQKDGVGWDKGLEPKLIKGPDTLVKAIRRASKQIPLFMLLAGPARGFVMRGLDDAGVPYMNTFVKEHSDMLTYYHACDAYLISSRDEGGPLALLESFATKVPVISTKVGMSPDLIKHGENGLLAEIEDDRSLADSILRIAASQDFRQNLTDSAHTTIQGYDWKTVTENLVKNIYDKAV